MSEDASFLYQIARLYHKEGLKQQEISKRLGISRATISRALAAALRKGIVRIDVLPPPGDSEREAALASRLGLRKVVIAEGPGSAIEEIARTGGAYLGARLQEGMTVGIGWGATVYETASRLQCSRRLASLRLVPLVGSLGRNEPRFQVNVILSKAAERTGGDAYFFNIPAFVREGQEFVDCLLNDANLKTIFDLWESVDIAIVGLGSFSKEPSFPVADYSKQTIGYLADQGVVGDILGRFFNRDHLIDIQDEKNKPLTETVYIGIPSRQLAASGEIVCLAGGPAKVPALETAARLGLITTLVTDARTAGGLEALLGKEGR